MPHSTFNWVDVLSIALLVWAGYIGWAKGLTVELFRFIGVLVSMFISLHFYDNLSAWSETKFLISRAYGDIAWFVILLCVCFLCFKLMGILLEKIVKVKFSAKAEKPGGLTIGILRGILGTSLMLFAIKLIPIEYLQSSVEKSFIGYYLSRISIGLYNWFLNVF
jgi:uncharacterized membrane protein required for colicin V production